MKKILLLVLIALTTISCGRKRVSFENLEERDGLYYEINSQTPFSGIGEQFYGNGHQEREVSLINGKFDGPWKSYYENRQLEREGNYKNGKREGFWKWYYENGQLKIELFFKKDKGEGLGKVYFENGQLKEEVNFKNGEEVK